MVKKTFELMLENGMHARPAGLLVKTIGRLNVTVTLSADGKSVNGKSIMAIMSASFKHGVKIDITCEGDDADKAMTAIEDLFAVNFNE
jgi:phosphocarrier protein